MTPQTAINIAERRNICKIKHRAFLFKTEEASKHIKMDTSEPYLLVIEDNWTETYPVRDANNNKLKEVCDK